MPDDVRTSSRANPIEKKRKTMGIGAEPAAADHDPALIEDAGNHPGDESRGFRGFTLTGTAGRSRPLRSCPMRCRA